MRKLRYIKGFKIDEDDTQKMKGCQLHMVINVHNINQGKILDLLDNLDYEFTSMIKEEIENTGQREKLVYEANALLEDLDENFYVNIREISFVSPGDFE